MSEQAFEPNPASTPDSTPDSTPQLTHVDSRGAARMVDVSAKEVTVRTATASGQVEVSPAVVELLRGPGVAKGDALAVARIAGIAAAKRTPDLIPLCHPVAIHAVAVESLLARQRSHPALGGLKHLTWDVLPRAAFAG